MGSFARYSRAERFIDEFGDEILERVKVHLHECVSQALDLCEGDEVVRLHVLVRETTGGQRTLTAPDIFFDPEAPREDAVDRVAEILAGGPADNDEFRRVRAEVHARFEKADLL